MSTSLDLGDVNSNRVTLEEGNSVRTEASLVMEGEERELPEELVERIIARMPFPSLFKARVLSKRWYCKFSSTSQLGSSEASAFQSQVSGNSASWPTYAPVFFNWDTMSLPAFDGIKYQRFSLLSTDWQNAVDCTVWYAGVVVLFIGKCHSVVIVTNILTGSYRHLTLPPHLGFKRIPGPKLLGVIAGSCLSYKVFAVYSILVPENTGSQIDALCLHLYDSGSHTWTSTVSKFRDHPALNGFRMFGSRHCAYMDGKVYFLAMYRRYEHVLSLGSYDLEDNAWRIVVEDFEDQDVYSHESGVLRCGDKIIVVIVPRAALLVEAVGNVLMGSIQEKSIQVFQLDVQSLELALISYGPPETVAISGTSIGLTKRNSTGHTGLSLSSDANFVYFNCGCLPLGSVVKFDLSTGLWSSVSLTGSTSNFNGHTNIWMWSPGTFKPGLNPFVSA